MSEGITVKRAAELMNVSPRMIYKAREVRRLRPDLEPEIKAGRLSMHKAWLIARGKKPPTKREKFIRVWNALDVDDQSWLTFQIMKKVREVGRGRRQ